MNDVWSFERSLIVRYLVALGCCVALTLALSAQEAREKPDYTDLSKLIRSLALKEAPKEFTASPGWGQSKPFPPRLRLPNLPRTTIKVGDRLELAHGSWKKAKVWMDNPERDFTLAVTELKPQEASKYRLALTSTAPLLIDFEFQQWLNGLMLVGVNGRAKAKVKVDLDCDVGLTLNVTKFPPEVSVDPKIAKTKIEVRELEVFNPGTAKRPDLAQTLNGEIQNFVQGMVQDAEPKIQDEANRAIAQALREGKGTFSASKLYETIKK
jgi:alpha-D-ribose 1-methylphosphonate 5-triphosphate synthase subunit PhnH